MKLNILDAAKTNKGSVDMPAQFTEPVRADLIRKAVDAVQSTNRQPYGASPDAGKRSSSIVSKRRRKYRGSYGFGISRTPRKVMSRRGTRMNWTGAFAPNTVGGRRAHPPKASKIWAKSINDKERRKAIRSALAATLDKSLVQAKGHQIPDSYPFIIDDTLQKLEKTKDVVKALSTLGFDAELDRTSTRKIRAGKGTMRGRKYRQKTGILFVIDDECKLYDAAQNVPGVEILTASALNAEVLAPGGVPGRLTLFTKSAIQRIADEKLYTDKPALKGAEKKHKASAKKKTTKTAVKVLSKAAQPAKKETPKTAPVKADSPKKETKPAAASA